MGKISMAVSENRSLPAVHMAGHRGCPAAGGASSVSEVLLNVTPVLIHWVLPHLETSLWSFCPGSSWLYIVSHLWDLPLSVLQRALLVPSVPQPACGRGWDGRRWKHFLQFGVQNWFGSMGRGRRRMCRSCSEGWRAGVLSSCLFFSRSSCSKLSYLWQFNKTALKSYFLFGVKHNYLSYKLTSELGFFFKVKNCGSF